MVFNLFGLQTTPATDAAIYNLTTPLFVLILGRVWFGERLTLPRVLGIAVAFLGAAVLVTGGSIGLGGGDLQGALYILLSAMLWAGYTLALRRAGIGPWHAAALVNAYSVVALVPGDRRADSSKIARLAGSRRAAIAKPAEVVDATGFEPGGVAPFPLERVPVVLVERTLVRHPVVWAGAGSDRHMVALAPRELVRLTRGRVEDVVRDSP